MLRVAAACAVSVIALLCGPHAHAQRTVRVAVYDSPPKMLLQGNEDPQGFYSDLLADIARQEGWRIEYVPGTFKQALARLDAHEVDLLADILRTPDRASRFSFGKEPTLLLNWPQVFAREELHIRSVSELSGRRIGVLSGSLQEARFPELASKYGASTKMIGFPTYSEAFDALGDGRVDAVLGLNTLGGLAAKHEGIEETPLIFSPSPVHFAAPLHANADLLAALDRRLRAMKADPQSTYYRALHKWMSSKRGKLPNWVYWAAAGAALLSILSVAWALTLRRAFRRLAESKRGQAQLAGEFQHVLDNSLDVIAVLDGQLRIQRVSGACEALWGYLPHQLLGRSPCAFSPESDQPLLASELAEVRATGQGRCFESRTRNKAGAAQFVVWSAVWTHSDQKMYCVIRDDSERRELLAHLQVQQRELQSANDNLQSFARSVSHDLRAPLDVMNGFVSKVLRDNLGVVDDRSATLLRRAMSAGERMSQIITDLLRLARTSDQKLQRTACDLSSMAHQIVDALRLTQPRPELMVTIAPGMVVSADAQMIRIALENLVGNAWKFSLPAQNPAIEVGEECTGDERVYFVRDNGAGFDMAYADKLFQPFQRLHASAEFSGSGIGLSIVARIIARHGGRIWAESAPGDGATFRFSLGSLSAQYRKADEQSERSGQSLAHSVE